MENCAYITSTTKQLFFHHLTFSLYCLYIQVIWCNGFYHKNMGSITASSNLGRGTLHFTSRTCLFKDMTKSCLLPPAIYKVYSRFGFLRLVRQPVKEKKNLLMHPIYIYIYISKGMLKTWIYGFSQYVYQAVT